LQLRDSTKMCMRTVWM